MSELATRFLLWVLFVSFLFLMVKFRDVEDKLDEILNKMKEVSES